MRYEMPFTKRLVRAAPPFPLAPESPESALAAALRGHVEALAGDIGERSIVKLDAVEAARRYIEDAFRERGFEPAAIPFRRSDENGRGEIELANVEVRVAGNSDARGVLIVGAHYDTAIGTPGADDNASGVAVLLELARFLRVAPPFREIRLVAFAAEEKPARALNEMGSFHYLRRLIDEQTPIEGMISLEMLGYFNDKAASQCYPAGLGLCYPNRGDYVALVGNLRSGRFVLRARSRWASKRVPFVTVILPSVISSITRSDHINFWREGLRAAMLTDTAFFRNPFYHDPADTPEKLDYARMADVTTALSNALQRL